VTKSNGLKFVPVYCMLSANAAAVSYPQSRAFRLDTNCIQNEHRLRLFRGEWNSEVYSRNAKAGFLGMGEHAMSICASMDMAHYFKRCRLRALRESTSAAHRHDVLFQVIMQHSQQLRRRECHIRPPNYSYRKRLRVVKSYKSDMPIAINIEKGTIFQQKDGSLRPSTK